MKGCIKVPLLLVKEMSEISVINDKRSIFCYHQEKRKELRRHIHLSFREIALPASLQNLVW